MINRASAFFEFGGDLADALGRNRLAADELHVAQLLLDPGEVGVELLDLFGRMREVALVGDPPGEDLADPRRGQFRRQRLLGLGGRLGRRHLRRQQHTARRGSAQKLASVQGIAHRCVSALRMDVGRSGSRVHLSKCRGAKQQNSVIAFPSLTTIVQSGIAKGDWLRRIIHV